MQIEAHPGSWLIATLGSEAQVITAAYDLLLRQSEMINCVQVLHTTAADNTPVAIALERLKTEFHPPVPIYFLPIRSDKGQMLADVDTPETARAAFRAIYRAVWSVKHDHGKVHLSIAGGRKTMAVYGMTAAQLLFDEEDQLWHLFSAGDFLDSKRLHPEAGDEVHLVEIPVIRWGEVTPAAWMLEDIDDPYQAIERVRALQLVERIHLARSFIKDSLTPAEVRVVELLVREGLGDIEIAERLYLSRRTVEQQLRSAYRKAAAHWGLEQANRTQLIALLNLYFSMQITGKPA